MLSHLASYTLLFFLTSQIHETLSLIAYDCMQTTANITSVSLIDVQACPEYSQSVKDEEVVIQVVQRRRFNTVHVYQCKATTYRDGFYCGMHSHNSRVKDMLKNYVEELGAERCLKIHNTNTWIYGGHTTIDNLRSNSSRSESIVIAGSLTSDGTCKGAEYKDGVSSWSNVVVVASVTIVLKDYEAAVSREDMTVILPSGIHCAFKNKYCMDYESGEAVWNNEKPEECSNDAHDVLYEGPATLASVSGPIVDNVGKTIIVNRADSLFAFSLIRLGHLCYQDCYETEHPQIVVIIQKSYGFFFQKRDLGIKNTDLMAYVNSKFMFVEQHFRGSLNELSSHVYSRLCTIDRDLMLLKLSAARQDPTAFAQWYNQGPGVHGRVMGEILYVIQCQMVEASLRSSERCYQEIPVTYNNDSLFMSPQSRIIRRSGMEVECSSLAPTGYYLSGEWVGFAPDPIHILPPQILTPSRSVPWRYTSIRHLGSGGLYSALQIKKLQDAMLFPEERAAITNIVGLSIKGFKPDYQGFQTQNILSPDTVKDIAKDLFRDMWGWFYDFGVVVAGLSGIWIITKIIIMVVTSSINGFTIYKTVGCGLSLFASIFDSLTVWILNRAHKELGTKTIDHDMQKLSHSSVNMESPDEPVFLPRTSTSPYNAVVGI